MIKKRLVFICDNPNCDHLCNNFLFYCNDFYEARSLGWVVSHDRKKCYCPSCSSFFKSVGRKGVNESYKTLSLSITEV